MTTKHDYVEGATYQSEATPILIKNLPAGGSLRVSASYGELLGELLFSIPANERHVKVITVEEPVYCYSIIYDKSKASDPEACLTYAGLCEGFTPMSGSNEGSWAEGNGAIFDAIEVGYLNGTTWTKFNKSSVAGSTSYDCFTKIPKVYQKVTDLGNNKVQLDLALEPFDGASLHPAFVRSGSEINHLYIGRYLAYNSSSKLYSYSGKTPTGSVTRANFRVYARNRGTAYSLMKYYDWDLVNKLYLLAFKNFYSQSALGPGLTNGNKSSTGGTNSKSWMHGGDGLTSMSFLGIEDWWGNCWQFIDDFYGNGGVYYAGNNTTPTDNSSNKTQIGSGLTSSGYYLTCKATADGFFLAETSGGSGSTGLCDYQYYDSGENLGDVGGDSSLGSTAGAFTLDAAVGLSASSSRLGARLTYVD